MAMSERWSRDDWLQFLRPLRYVFPKGLHEFLCGSWHYRILPDSGPWDSLGISAQCPQVHGLGTAWMLGGLRRWANDGVLYGLRNMLKTI